MAADSMRKIPNFEDNTNDGNNGTLTKRNGYGCINSAVLSENEGCFIHFDDILKSVGEFGFWQKVFYFLTCAFVNIPTGIQLTGVFFVSGTPKFQCSTPSVDCDVDKCCDNCTEYNFIQHFTTTTTEYNLICHRAYIAANVQAGFMAGMLVGSFIFGIVADAFGRRFCMFLCSLLMTVFSLGAVYTHSLVLFTILRFANAASLAGFLVAQFVYSLEIVGPSYRTMAGQCSQLFFVAGQFVVAFLAYYIREWRTLLLVISFPPALFVFSWLVVPESPRWLVVQGRTDEAARVLVKFSDESLAPVDTELLRSALDRCQQGETDAQARKTQHSPVDLLRTPRMRKRTLISWFSWMVASLVCYGFMFYLSDLAGNPYLNVVLMYGSDIPGCLIGWIAIQKFGRRITCCVFMIVGGVICLIVLAVPKDQTQVSTVLALIGRFPVSMTFTIVFLYASELYPTSIRNLAVGSCSTFARLGSTAAPYVVMLSQLPGVSVTFPMVIFGVLAVTAGLMILWLPETLHSNMCQTIEEVSLAEERYDFIWMGKRVGNPISSLRSFIFDVNSSQDVPSRQEFVTENSPLI